MKSSAHQRFFVVFYRLGIRVAIAVMLFLSASAWAYANTENSAQAGTAETLETLLPSECQFAGTFQQQKQSQKESTTLRY